MKHINYQQFKANIRNYIELNKALTIAKLGRLEVLRQSSSFSPNGKSIIPPHHLFKIDQSIINVDTSFVSFMTDINGISYEENLISYKDFCNELVQEIESTGTAALENLGYFFKRENKLCFSQNFEIPYKSSFGLPSLTLQPLQDKANEEDLIIQKSTNNKNIKESNSGRVIFWNVIGTAAVFLLLVLTHKLINGNFNSVELFSKENTSHIDPSKLNKKPETVLIDNPSYNNFIPGISNNDYAPPKSSCALIVGSFSNKFLAADLQQKILNLDLELYTEEFHEFFRVGISVDCESIKGSTFLEIEKVLGIDPWLRIY